MTGKKERLDLPDGASLTGCGSTPGAVHVDAFRTERRGAFALAMGAPAARRWSSDADCDARLEPSLTGGPFR